MSEPRTRIDDAIDRAVRDIIRHDPPAGFRRRVLSRLDAPARRAFLWPALATAAAAIAIFAIARGVVRDAPQGHVNRPPEAAARVPDHPAAAPDPTPKAHIGTRAAAPPIRRAPRQEPVRTATFGPREGRVSATNLRPPLPVAMAEEDPAVPALPPIAVTALAPLPPLEIAPIVVAPIQIPRVHLVPLSPPR